MALINVVNKIEKARQGLDMPAHEQIVAACTTNPKGTMKRGVAAGIGGVVGAAVVARSTATVDASTAGLAERFVSGQHAMVLTDQRLFLAKMSGLTGKPKEVVASWARSEVAQISVEETRLAYPMTISFTDGSTVTVEGAKGTDPRALAL